MTRIVLRVRQILSFVAYVDLILEDEVSLRSQRIADSSILSLWYSNLSAFLFLAMFHEYIYVEMKAVCIKLCEVLKNQPITI